MRKARCRISQHGLLHPRQQRSAPARRQHQVVIALDRRFGQPLRVAVAGREVGPDRGFRQREAHRLHHGGHVRFLAIGKAGARKSVGRNQHEFRNPLRMVRRHVPGNPSPDGIANDRRLVDAEPVHQNKDQGDGACVSIVTGRVRRREARAGQVEPHDAVVRLQRLGPGLECVQAGTEAVQQNDGWRILRPVFAHMQLGACDRQHVARLAQVYLLERGARRVRRVQPAATEQHRRQRHPEKDRS